MGSLTSLDLSGNRIQDLPSQVAGLVAEVLELAGREFPDQDGGPGRLPQAQGQALRAVRQRIFASDPARAFGDMRRVPAPPGELLWVCPEHYREYDPGLPTLR